MPPRATFLRPSSLEALESRIAPALIYGVDNAGKLVAFDSTKSTVLLSSKTITGLGVGETIVGVDFRPLTNQLYAVTKLVNQGHLYTINTATGAASGVGGFFSVALNGTEFDIDFNPQSDQLRIVSNLGQNLRVDPSGVVVDGNPNQGGPQGDANLTYKAGDANAGKTPTVTGIAYSNSFAGATSTQLFDLDRALGVLAQQDLTNGALTTKGSLKVAATAVGGFDILPGNTLGFADLTVAGADQLYLVNTVTGATALVGKIGPAGTHLVSFAALPSGLSLVGKVASYRDVDGDLSTVTFSKGMVTPELFSLSKPNAIGGVQLYKLNLANAADGFAGGSVTFTARASIFGGDGFADVGRIDATKIDLLALTVRGDLGSLSAGDATLTTAAIGNLKVSTTGAYGTFTQGNVGDTIYTLQGNLGTFFAGGDSKSTLNISGAVGTLSIAGTLAGAINVGSITTLAKFGGTLGGAFKAAGDVKKIMSGPVLVSSLGVGGALGSLAITGDFFGSQLTVGGHADPLTATQAQAVGAMSFTGSINGSQIFVGYTTAGAPVNPDVQIGAVTVNGSFNTSVLAVGLRPGADGAYGTNDDVSITPPVVLGQPPAVAGGNPNIVSRIASITVKGSVLGTPGTTDSYGFVANQIGAATIGGLKQPLTLALDALLLSATRDIAIREYA